MSNSGDARRDRARLRPETWPAIPVEKRGVISIDHPRVHRLGKMAKAPDVGDGDGAGGTARF